MAVDVDYLTIFFDHIIAHFPVLQGNIWEFRTCPPAGLKCQSATYRGRAARCAFVMCELLQNITEKI